MLVVILILAILLSIALPLYQNTIQDSTKKAARTNMQTIATAMAAYQVRSPTHSLPTDINALYAPPSDLSAVSGPGNRTYTFITSANGGSCYTPMLVQGTYSVANYTLLPGQFAVESINNGVTSGGTAATSDDWCYVPGVSVE
jgi:type II secretory pathway pseudopilin PulG